MTFKKRTDQASRNYWAFVERTAQQVGRELPSWARNEATTTTTSRPSKTKLGASKRARAKVS